MLVPRVRTQSIIMAATLALGACDEPTASSHIAFTVQPGDAQGMVAISPAVQVVFRDASGVPVAEGVGEAVIALDSNPNNARLFGTTTVRAVGGTATFSDLRIDRPGTYVLVATALGFAPAKSTPFAIRLAFTALSVGARNTCANTADATYCWGNNDNGQIGNEDTSKTRATFADLVTTNGQPELFSEVRAANAFACGVKEGGSAYCWGLNEYGDLGIGTADGPRECSPGFSCSVTPLPVTGGLTFSTIASAGFSCGISDELYCWGLNNVGQLVGAGVPHGINSPTPVALAGASGFVAVAVGAGHGCGLMSDHTAWCWGTTPAAPLGIAPSRIDRHRYAWSAA
jgi:hypothetical protein